MASKTTLNARNLEALGASHLAALLIEITKGDAGAKRRLRMELAAMQGSGVLAKEVRKRLATIARSRAFVDWQGVPALAGDLDTQRRSIAGTVAKDDPQTALDLIWRFMELANTIFERCHDRSGRIIGVFHQALDDLGELAERAKADPTALADRAFDALCGNGYGQFDGLISVLTPALGSTGLEHLKQRMVDLSKTPVKRPADEDRVVVGWSSNGPFFADAIAEGSRGSTVRLALKDIADAQGDPDAFMTQYDEKVRKVPRIAAEISRRFLDAGRVDEALAALEMAEHRDTRAWPEFEWGNARIDVLEALGRTDDAQRARWSCFERSLSATHLRAYLKQLPDFDDIEEEEKALAHAETYKCKLAALSFLVSWPALERAARLVTGHAGNWDGDHYEILGPSADALAGSYPLAATLLLRAMIDFSLREGRSSRYKHAARHLLECESLAASIEDFGEFATHSVYETGLRTAHGRKSSFWNAVK